MTAIDRERQTAYAWLRVSSSTQDVARQRAAIESWAKERSVNIEQWYDVVESRHAEHRAYAQILERATKSPPTYLVCSEIDRLGLRGTFDFVNDLRALGVRIASVAEGEEHGGFIVGGIRLVLSQAEIERLSLRTSAGSRLAATKGFWNGGPCPYGYRTLYVNVDGKLRRTLEIVPEEAAHIRRAFEMCNRGASNHEIGAELGWHAQTVYQRLTNPVYTGSAVYNRKSAKLGRRVPGYQKIVWRPKSDWIVTANSHPAIVDLKTFNGAAESMRSRRYYPGGRTPQLLSGKAFCADCNGRRLRITRSRCGKLRLTRLYYACPDCSTWHRVDRINEFLLIYLRERLTKPDKLKTFLPRKRQDDSAQDKRELKTVATKIENIMRAIENDQGQSARLVERLGELETRERELRAKLARPAKREAGIEDVRRAIRQVIDEWSREAILSHIERVDIRADGSISVRLVL